MWIPPRNQCKHPYIIIRMLTLLPQWNISTEISKKAIMTFNNWPYFCIAQVRMYRELYHPSYELAWTLISILTCMVSREAPFFVWWGCVGDFISIFLKVSRFHVCKLVCGWLWHHVIANFLWFSLYYKPEVDTRLSPRWARQSQVTSVGAILKQGM